MVSQKEMESLEFLNVDNPALLLEKITKEWSLEDALKEAKKVRNKELDGFERFKSYILLEWVASKNKEGSFFKEFSDIVKERGVYEAYTDSTIKDVLRTMISGKLIKIDDELNKSLEKTKNHIYKRNLPFDDLVIPCNLFLDKNRFNIYCLIVSNVEVVSRNKKEIKVVLFGLDSLDNSEFWLTYFIDERGIVKSKMKKHYDNVNFVDINNKGNNKLTNETGMFISNIIDFMNHPDVEIRKVKFFNNESRIKRGKLPHLETIIINVKGKLYRYIYEELPNKINSSPMHSFYVRGHYIHFWNKQRWKRIYSIKEIELKENGYQMNNNIIIKWKPPFIKGKGLIKIKPYKLKNETKIS